MADRQNSATPDRHEGSSVSSRQDLVHNYQPSFSAQTGSNVVAPPIIGSTLRDVHIHVNSPGQGSASSSHGMQPQNTHVAVNVPHGSVLGLVWDRVKSFINITQPIRGQILLFLRPPRGDLRILDVFLLQDNIPLSEIAAQHGEAEYIAAPSKCRLSSGQSYSVQCEQASKVQPEDAQFDEDYGPNFFPTFEVLLPANSEEVTLMVQDQKKKPVWNHVVNLTDSRKKNLRNLPAGDLERTTMSEEDILHILNDLSEDDFENFKWSLRKEMMGDISPIPWAQLEEARRRDVVDLMLQHYELAGAVEVMKSILKKIRRNDLVMMLSNISS